MAVILALVTDRSSEKSGNAGELQQRVGVCTQKHYHVWLRAGPAKSKTSGFML